MSAVCPDMALKDNTGKVITKAERKHSKVVTEQIRDKIKLVKVQSVKATIKNIALKQVASRTKATARRAKKNKGKVYKRKSKKHDVLAAESESVESAESTLQGEGESISEPEKPKEKRRINYAYVEAEKWLQSS